MAFTYSYMYTGETNDSEVLSSMQAGTAVETDASIAQTGSACLSSLGDISGLNGLFGGVASIPSASIIAASFAVAIDQAPSGVAHKLLQNAASAGLPPNAASLNPLITVGTDRKFYFYDKNGNQLAVSTTLCPLVSGGVMQEMTYILDGLTLGTVWLHVFFGDTSPEISINTGLAQASIIQYDSLWWGMVTAGGDSVPGSRLKIDDAMWGYSTVANDAPHTTAYPRPRGKGGMNHCEPTATVSGYTDWTANGATAVECVDADELPNHDSDTTHIQGNAINQQELYTYSSANPMPVGATVIKVQQSLVHRLTSDNKQTDLLLYKLAGTELAATIETPGTAYIGWTGRKMLRPSGDFSWVQADGDLTGGVSKLAFGVQTSDQGDIGNNVTLLPGPEWIYYTDTLPLAPTPATTGDRRRAVAQVI